MFRRKSILTEANLSPNWLDSNSWRSWEAPCNLVREEQQRQEALLKHAGPLRPQGYLIPCPVTFVREPTNPHDTNAIRAMIGEDHVGYLAKEIAERLAPLLDKSGCTQFTLAGVIRGGSNNFPTLGIHVWPSRRLNPGPSIEISSLAGLQVSWPPWGGEGDLSFVPSTSARTGDQRSTHESRSESKVEAGYFKGKHYTDYVEDIKGLKRQGDLDQAEQLLLALVDAVEAEAKEQNWGVAPWYYEQLAIIYRKRGDAKSEVEILERYANHEHAPGVSPPQLLERLQKARMRLERESE